MGLAAYANSDSEEDEEENDKESNDGSEESDVDSEEELKVIIEQLIIYQRNHSTKLLTHSPGDDPSPQAVVQSTGPRDGGPDGQGTGGASEETGAAG